MARFLTGLFGGSKQTQIPATTLRINTSLQGVPIPIILGGAQRIAGNVIDYVFLQSYPLPSGSGGGGGKGGSGGSGKGSSGSVQYFVTFLVGFCEGPVQILSLRISGVSGNVPTTDVPGQITVPSPGGSTTVNCDFLSGSYTQAPWGYFEVILPSHALNYRGLSYGAFENYPLGQSTTLPNVNVDVLSNNNRDALPAQHDGDVAVALTMFLTDEHFGLGFPANSLGDLSQWKNYCLSLGFVVSPVLTSSVQSSAFINDLCVATNSAACWQDGQLTVVPYGDTSVTAGSIQVSVETFDVPVVTDNAPTITVEFNGTFVKDLGVTYATGVGLQRVFAFVPGISPSVGQYYESVGQYIFSIADFNAQVTITYEYAATASFVPDLTPIYDFTIDDCLPNQSSVGSGASDANSPFTVVRKPRDQMLNSVKVEYLDRNNNYNPVVVEIKDEASIIAYGRERPGDIKQLHFFCLAGAAQQSATLQLIRQQIPRTFQWTVGRHFGIIMKLMALATVTDPGQGLARQSVRIIEIQENQDFSLTLTAEEFPGTLAAPLYGTEANLGYIINFNEDPGGINTPLIFEPPDEFGGGNVIMCAVSFQNPALGGGANIWVSNQPNGTYVNVGKLSPARMGVTTADFGTVPVNANGQTIDQTNTLQVDLTESQGALGSGITIDAVTLADPCYVGGEIITYATATLLSQYKYAINYLVRGAFGTEASIVDHPAGTMFARLDSSVGSFPFNVSQIGKTIYIKFQGFNIFEGGQQSLADVVSFPYTIQGTALGSPLPNVQNLRVYYDVNLGFTVASWDQVQDFRSVDYEIRSGSSWASGQSLGRVPAPPFRVPGDGTFWIAAHAQPVSGLNVYSETPVDVVITGAVIRQNIINTFDFKALGWPGSFTGGAGVDSTLNAIRTGAGNILVDPNILATSDILSYGGAASGAYLPGINGRVNAGYVANISVSIAYIPTGVPIGQNILAIPNILALADFLGSASTAFTNVFPQIRIATTQSGGNPNFGPWQSFSPGTYQAQWIETNMQLNTSDPNTYAYSLGYVLTATIPARIDNYALTTQTGGAITVEYAPGGGQSVATNNSTASSSAVLHVAAVPSWVAAGMYAFDATTPAAIVGGQKVLSTAAGVITLTANVDATVANGDLIVFSTVAPAAFNNGQNGLPAIQGTIVNAQAGDDLVLASASLSSVTVKVTNAGSNVARTVNLTVEGY